MLLLFIVADFFYLLIYKLTLRARNLDNVLVERVMPLLYFQTVQL